MKDIEIRILKELYQRPNDGNFTDEILIDSLGISKTLFNDTIKSLIDYGYAYERSKNNQINEGQTAYRITALGAKAINEIDSKGLTGVIKKYGKYISWSIAILGAIGVFFQILFGIRSDAYNNKQLQIQQQQLQIQLQTQEQKKPDTNHLLNKKNVLPDSTKD